VGCATVRSIWRSQSSIAIETDGGEQRIGAAEARERAERIGRAGRRWSGRLAGVRNRPTRGAARRAGRIGPASTNSMTNGDGGRRTLRG
jgi:hypothetical protein